MKKRFFDLAKKISNKSNHPQHRIGSVLIYKSKVISFGYNQIKTHPKSPHAYKNLHAEIHCILGIPLYQLNGATLYVFRKTKNNTLAMAKPCESCEKLIKQVGIKRVCYSTNKGFIEQIYDRL